jgi:hypothetical protein
MGKTQLETLLERRDEALKMIMDPAVSRESFLNFFKVSTRALHKFMSIEDVSWARKPHDGTNQYTGIATKVNEEIRLKIENNEEINDLYFSGDPKSLSQTGIYRIVSSSGGVYIGMASISFRRRFTAHRTMLNEGNHHCKGLQRAFDKNPHCVFEIIEIIEDRDIIPQRELDHWLSHREQNIKLYNGKPGGDGVTVYHTEETKKRLSEAALARFAFSIQELEEIYQKICVEGRSVNSVKKELGCAGSKIRRLLVDKGWDASHEARIKLHMKTILEAGVLGRHYRDVSRELNIPREMIQEIFKNNGLSYITGELTSEEKAIALDLYSKKGQTISEISSITNVSYSRLQSFLNSVNAEKGVEDKWHRDKATGEIIVDQDLLKDLTSKEKMSVTEISVKLDLDVRVIKNSLKRL